MDSGVDEELNYEEEEDEIENDESCKDSENRECTQDSATNNSNLESDDQYLQIDYVDDENLAQDNAVPLENPPPDTTSDTTANDRKAVNKNENSNLENVSTVVQKELNPTRKSGGNVGNAVKRKKKLRPFQRRAEFKKKLTNAFCFNPWLPEYNFLDRQRLQFFNRSPLLTPKQDFYPIQSSPIPHLMSNIKGYPRSPTTRLGIGVSRQSFPQQSNNLSANLLGQSFSGDGPSYQVENGLRSPSFGYKGVKPDLFSSGCSVSHSSGFQIKSINRINQSFVNNFQTRNSPKSGYAPGPHGGNATNVSFSEQDSKFYPVKNEERFVSNNVQYKPFQEEEKKVIMMKKEARLKRFMQDDLIKKDKLTDSGFEESSQYGSPPKVQLFEKKDKKLFNEDQPINFVSCHEREVPPEKPDINKELLLRKKNPFGGNLDTSNFSLAPKPNQNQTEKIGVVKVERVDTKPCTTTTTGSTCSGGEQQPTKMEVPSQCLVPIKTEPESHVKFIRTISKSFDELTFKKPKTEGPEPQGKLFPFVGGKICETFPKQLEPQLTGCIVKVLNIPPSTTTNDILALCSSVGMVLEVKLNCPKENSVVIRFPEPKLAEKFFSLYHGQKMNNYFLNVIIV